MAPPAPSRERRGIAGSRKWPPETQAIGVERRVAAVHLDVDRASIPVRSRIGSPRGDGRSSECPPDTREFRTRRPSRMSGGRELGTSAAAQLRPRAPARARRPRWLPVTWRSSRWTTYVAAVTSLPAACGDARFPWITRFGGRRLGRVTTSRRGAPEERGPPGAQAQTPFQRHVPWTTATASNQSRRPGGRRNR